MSDQIDAPEIIRPTPDCLSFRTADGTLYTFTDGLSVARQRIFQRLQTEFGMDTSLRGFADGLNEIRTAFNKGDFMGAAAVAGKLMEGIEVMGANRLREVECVALFANAENEDPGNYSFEAMKDKCYGPGKFASVASGFFFLKTLQLLPAGYGSMYPLPGAEAAPLTDEL